MVIIIAISRHRGLPSMRTAPQVTADASLGGAVHEVTLSLLPLRRRSA
jgi:hypothetical protein